MLLHSRRCRAQRGLDEQGNVGPVPVGKQTDVGGPGVISRQHRQVPSGPGVVAVEELTPEQGRQLFDRMARERLGMSGEEFLAAWHSGRLAEDDRPEVVELSMLIPFAE